MGVGTWATPPMMATRPAANRSGTYSAIGMPTMDQRSTKSRMTLFQSAGQLPCRCEFGVVFWRDLTGSQRVLDDAVLHAPRALNSSFLPA